MWLHAIEVPMASENNCLQRTVKQRRLKGVQMFSRNRGPRGKDGGHILEQAYQYHSLKLKLVLVGLHFLHQMVPVILYFGI